MSLVTPLTSLGYSGIKLWKGFGTGSDGDVTIADGGTVTITKYEYNTRNFTLTNNTTIVPQDRKQIILIRATESITINSGSTINVTGKGFAPSETGSNYFNIPDAHGGTINTRNAMGISGGGSYSGDRGQDASDVGAYPVDINTFLSFIQQHVDDMFVDNVFAFQPFGGSGGPNEQSGGYGGECVLLVAPTVINNGTILAGGTGGAVYTNWLGTGGGGGGWIGVFANSFSGSGGMYANGGGGGTGGYNRTCSAGANGGTTGGKGADNHCGGYARGAGGGGSTALNANGGTPGAGGQGSQKQGTAGTTEGRGGVGTNYGGSNRGGSGGGGGAAGKVTYVQINK